MSEHQNSQSKREERERRRVLRPRIYVASLSDFNAGRLHGAWLDADADADELHNGVAAMLAGSPQPDAEEWAVHDHDGFAGLRLHEFETLETVSRLGRGLRTHGAAFAGLVDLLGVEAATDEAFERHYRGHWDSAHDYAEDLLADLGAEQYLEQVPAWLQPYVRLDVDAFARDLQLGGDLYVTEADAGVHIFDSTA